MTCVRERHVEGGLPHTIDSLLRDRPDLLCKAAEELLVSHFPASLHADICDAVGLDLAVMVASKRRRRDPAFAEKVLRAYEHRCAMCGFRAHLDGTAIAVEAAHVRWHASGGPATIDNGLALCPMDHKLLDLGAFGISTERRIMVSSRFVDLRSGKDEIAIRAGRRLLGPQAGVAPVAEAYISWHTREVFRGPPKMATHHSPGTGA